MVRKFSLQMAEIADIYVVFALTDPESKQKGTVLLSLKKISRLSVSGKKKRKLGIRSSPTTEIIFEDCRVPKENLLGEVGDGFKIAMMTLDGGRNGIAAQAVGIAQGALDAAVIMQKNAFNLVNLLLHNKELVLNLADMATNVEAARLLRIKQLG